MEESFSFAIQNADGNQLFARKGAGLKRKRGGGWRDRRGREGRAEVGEAWREGGRKGDW